jgi:aryl-alcohol dehydrogenase-like predicted oxidoreductase
VYIGGGDGDGHRPPLPSQARGTLHRRDDDDDGSSARIFITSKISPVTPFTTLSFILQSKHQWMTADMSPCNQPDTPREWRQPYLTYEMGEHKAKAAFDAILQRLGVDCVDLVLIHWPGAARTKPDSPKHAAAQRETWKVLDTELARRRCRAIGVSNYTVRHLEEMVTYAEVLPAVNQVEMHPRCAQRQLVETCARMGITVVAYSPLGCGELLHEPAVAAAAARLGGAVQLARKRLVLTLETI